MKNTKILSFGHFPKNQSLLRIKTTLLSEHHSDTINDTTVTPLMTTVANTNGLDGHNVETKRSLVNLPAHAETVLGPCQWDMQSGMGWWVVPG